MADVKLNILLAGTDKTAPAFAALEGRLRSARKESSQFNATWEQTIGLARGAGTVLTGAGVGMMLLGKSSLDAAQQMEVYRQKLQVALKDSAKAEEMFEWAKGFSATSPFEMSEVVDATTRLELYGLSAKKWMPMVGNMAGAMGRRVTDGVEAVADAISGGGLERLKEFGISSQMLKGAGWTGSYQDAKGIATLKASLEKIMGEKFGGGMEKMASTVTGQLSNLSDALFQIKTAIGDSLLPGLKLVVPLATSLANTLAKVAESPAGKTLIAVGGALTGMAIPAGMLLMVLPSIKSGLEIIAGLFGKKAAAAVGGEAAEVAATVTGEALKTEATLAGTAARGEAAAAEVNAVRAGESAEVAAVATAEAEKTNIVRAQTAARIEALEAEGAAAAGTGLAGTGATTAAEAAGAGGLLGRAKGWLGRTKIGGKILAGAERLGGMGKLARFGGKALGALGLAFTAYDLYRSGKDVYAGKEGTASAATPWKGLAAGAIGGGLTFGLPGAVIGGAIGSISALGSMIAGTSKEKSEARARKEAAETNLARMAAMTKEQRRQQLFGITPGTTWGNAALDLTVGPATATQTPAPQPAFAVSGAGSNGVIGQVNIGLDRGMLTDTTRQVLQTPDGKALILNFVREYANRKGL